MNPLQMSLLIVETFLRYGVPAALKVIEIFNKPDPTLADWNSLFELSQKSNEQIEAEVRENMK